MTPATKLHKNIIFWVLIVVLLMPIFASADTGAGIKPSSFFYFLDIASEKVSLFFTFDERSKAEKVLSYVDERISELKEVALEDKPLALEAALKNYNKHVESAITHAKKVGDEDETEALLGSLYENTERYKGELDEIIPELAEDARDVILNVIEANQELQKDLLKEIVDLRRTVEELRVETEELKEEIEALKEDKKSQTLPEVNDEVLVEEEGKDIVIEEPIELPNTPTKEGPHIIEFPSGMIVEIDEDGNIVRIIKETPDRDPISPAADAPKTISISLGDVVVTTSSAHLEWTTNIPTESRIFLSGSGMPTKIYSSESGLSTRHVVPITGLTNGTSYLYEIEAIADGRVIKREGGFTTSTPPPLVPTKMNVYAWGTTKNTLENDGGVYCTPFVKLGLSWIYELIPKLRFIPYFLLVRAGGIF